MSAYSFNPAVAPELPILISVPHCGTAFPEEIVGEYKDQLVSSPDDTDWFVHELYDFAPAMGMPMIAAHYSRWVIDLNRDPESKPLYTDGRIITGLCPATTFLGESLYKDGRSSVAPDEVAKRLSLYYWNYHQKIAQELSRLREKFGVALLWDCHSIRQTVPTVQPDKFPDLILGDADGTSASPSLSGAAIKCLRSEQYSLSHNYPFKGGYITRHFGQPDSGQHALQLEMSKINYMNDEELAYNSDRAGKMRSLLQLTFQKLADQLLHAL